MADGSIRIDTRIDERGFNVGINRMVQSLQKLGKAMAVVFVARQVVNYGRAAVQTAADMANAFIGLESIINGQGRSLQQAKDFLREYTRDGLIPITAATAAYKNLLLRGYDDSQIVDILNRLKDSSAFARQGQLSMGEAVQRATEGLKNEISTLVDNAGVTENVAAMWRKYAEQIGTTANMLTIAQKREAEYQGIMHETRFQVGDAARLAGTYSGQLAALGVSFMNLRTAVGNTIIPILRQVMPIIKAAVDALTVFFNRLATLVNQFFGTSIGLAQTEQSVTALAEATAAAGGAQDDLAKKTAKAGKAAKGALAPFDELNVLQQESESSKVGAGAGFGEAVGGFDLGGQEEQLDKLTSKWEEFKAAALQFLEPLIDAWDRLKEAAMPLLKTLGGALLWLWDNILAPFATWILQQLLPALMHLLAPILLIADKVLQALGPAFDTLWQTFLKPVVDFIGESLISALDWLMLQLEGLHETIMADQESFNAFIVLLGLLALAILIASSPILLLIASLLILIAIIANWKTIWAAVSQAASTAWQQIVSLFSNAWDWFSAHVIQPISDGFERLLNSLRVGWQRTWDGIKTFIKNTINGIIGFINGMIRAIVGGINAVIGVLNALKIDIPEWVPAFGGKSFGLNIPLVQAAQIPYLAKGAVIPPNAAFAAVLGDQRSGRNLEAPEGLIRQIIREEMGGMQQGPVTITFNGTLAPLIRELKPLIEQENARLGESLVKGI